VAIDAKPVTELASPLAEPPAALAAECEDPAALPDKALSAGEVERLWAKDRAALVSCRDRHSGAMRFYARRDAGLAGR
jgi:hypothetical protein